MTEKLADGIWRYEEEDGCISYRIIKGDRCAWRMHNGELAGCFPVNIGGITPLRRIATIEGKPLVDEAVIEAIANAIYDVVFANPKPNVGRFTDILKQHLCEPRLDHDLYAHKCGAPCKACEADRPSITDTPHQLLKMVRQLVAAVPGAPLITDLPDSDHDSVAVGYVEWLVKENHRLQARIVELEATPTTNRYRETATGDEHLFLPADEFDNRLGLRLRDKAAVAIDDSNFTSCFTPIPAEEPIVRQEEPLLTTELRNAWRHAVRAFNTCENAELLDTKQAAAEIVVKLSQQLEFTEAVQ